MEFPDIQEEQDMQFLLARARSDRIHPIFTDGKLVVHSFKESTKLAFFRQGKAIAKYSLRGDGTWRRTE
jgi:hypothetical protein